MIRNVKIVKPIPLESPTSKLGHNEEILINDALSRMSTSLRIIDDRALAERYHQRLMQYVADFEKLWGLGDRAR